MEPAGSWASSPWVEPGEDSGLVDSEEWDCGNSSRAEHCQEDGEQSDQDKPDDEVDDGSGFLTRP